MTPLGSYRSKAYDAFRLPKGGGGAGTNKGLSFFLQPMEFPYKSMNPVGPHMIPDGSARRNQDGWLNKAFENKK